MENSSSSNMAVGESIFSKEELDAMKTEHKRQLQFRMLHYGIPPPERPFGQFNFEETIASTVTVATVQHEEIAITAQICCTVHGQGCPVNHSATYWATTLCRASGNPVGIPLIEDTGTTKNWIARSLASQLECDLHDAESSDFYQDVSGHTFTATKTVTMDLDGKTKRVIPVSFNVGPEGFPVQAGLIGTEFVSKTGHLRHLFPEQPDKTVKIIVAAKVSVIAAISYIDLTNVAKSIEQVSIEKSKESAATEATLLAQKRQLSAKTVSKSKKKPTKSSESATSSRKKD
jgi:hypothetical protein